MSRGLGDVYKRQPFYDLETNYWQEIYIVGSSFNQRHGASAIIDLFVFKIINRDAITI